MNKLELHIFQFAFFTIATLLQYKKQQQAGGDYVKH